MVTLNEADAEVKRKNEGSRELDERKYYIQIDELALPCDSSTRVKEADEL